MLALASLLRVVEEARSGPVAPELWLRAVMAQLHEASDVAPVEFQRLWRILQDPMSHAPNVPQGAYERGTTAMTQWAIIARGCGYPETIEASAAMQALARRDDGKPARPKQQL